MRANETPIVLHDVVQTAIDLHASPTTANGTTNLKTPLSTSSSRARLAILSHCGNIEWSEQTQTGQMSLGTRNAVGVVLQQLETKEDQEAKSIARAESSLCILSLACGTI